MNNRFGIINGCERFCWREGYFVNDGYGKFTNNSNKSSPGVTYNPAAAPATLRIIKTVDAIISNIITNGGTIKTDGNGD